MSFLLFQPRLLSQILVFSDEALEAVLQEVPAPATRKTKSKKCNCTAYFYCSMLRDSTWRIAPQSFRAYDHVPHPMRNVDIVHELSPEMHRELEILVQVGGDLGLITRYLSTVRFK
jgi:hypothetical protein